MNPFQILWLNTSLLIMCIRGKTAMNKLIFVHTYTQVSNPIKSTPNLWKQAFRPQFLFASSSPSGKAFIKPKTRSKLFKLDVYQKRYYWIFLLRPNFGPKFGKSVVCICIVMYCKVLLDELLTSKNVLTIYSPFLCLFRWLLFKDHDS